jgi:hypothetical protein
MLLPRGERNGIHVGRGHPGSRTPLIRRRSMPTQNTYTTEHRIGGFMVNMAMVVMAAAAFHDGLHNGVAEIETASGETDHDKTDHCR